MIAGDPASALRSLRDVGDLLGSFVLDDRGGLVARDCPTVFDDDCLEEVASRILRLRETLDAESDPLEHVLLDYGDHKLFVRALRGSTLVVLAPKAIDVPALRMATTLVGRRLERAVESDLRPPSLPAPPPPFAGALPPTSQSEAGLATPPSRPDSIPPPPPSGETARVAPKRMYRGVRIE